LSALDFILPLSDPRRACLLHVKRGFTISPFGQPAFPSTHLDIKPSLVWGGGFCFCCFGVIVVTPRSSVVNPFLLFSLFARIAQMVERLFYGSPTRAAKFSPFRTRLLSFARFFANRRFFLLCTRPILSSDIQKTVELPPLRLLFPIEVTRVRLPFSCVLREITDAPALSQKQ